MSKSSVSILLTTLMATVENDDDDDDDVDEVRADLHGTDVTPDASDNELP